MQSVILTQGCGCSVSRQLIHPSKKDVLVLSDHKLIMNCKISPIRTELFFFLPATPGGGGEWCGGRDRRRPPLSKFKTRDTAAEITLPTSTLDCKTVVFFSSKSV